MKIAYVAMQFPVPSEAFAAVELRALRRLGAKVMVFAYLRPPPAARVLLAERDLAWLPIDQGSTGALLTGLHEAMKHPVDSLSLVTSIVRHCWRRPLQLVKALALVPRSFSILRRLKALQPDVLHLFWGHYPSLIGLLALRHLPQTVISQFLGAYDLEEDFPLSALLARKADIVVTHVEANLPALEALGVSAERLAVNYRGIEIPGPPPAHRKTRGQVVIAERLVPQKCTADALAVFAKVAAELPQACLVVCGDGPERQSLERLANELGVSDRVTFVGHVPQQEVFRRLAEAEVALTMTQSPSERLPNFLKEAMLQRCLCLTTRSTGIEELIEEGETGLLVDYSDVDGAAAKLVAMLRDREAAERIRQQAQARILEAFDVDRLMAERLQVWTALCRARQAGERT